MIGNLITYDIRLGDSLELIKTLPEHEIDLIVTDPPYKIEINGGGIVGRQGHLKNIELGVGSNIEFDIVPFLYLLKSKLKKFNGYFWASTKQIKEYIDFAVENQFNYDVLVWNKTNPIPAKNNKYLPDTEWCVFMRESGATFNNNLPFNFYRKVFRTVLHNSEFGHPTEKPEWIMKQHILVSSNENDTILDPFMGSGTTGAAAIKSRRNFIGFEINPEYFKIAKQRIESEINQVRFEEVIE